MTVDQLIEKYIALRDKKQAMDKAHDEAVKPYAQALDTIETHVLDLLNQQKVDSFSARGIGTAYKTTTMQAKLADRPKLLADLMARLNDTMNTVDSMDEMIVKCAPLFDVFTNAVSKEWVKDYLDTNKAVPPGVEVNHFTKVGFRKA